MQISNVTVEACNLGRDFQWGGRQPMDVKAVPVSLEGDDGQRGTALAWTAELPVRAVVAAIEDDDGFVRAPDGPGFGLKLDRAALADRRINVD